jgi:hypothetical protein
MLPWWAYALIVGAATGGVAAATTYTLTRRWVDTAAQGIATFAATLIAAAVSRVVYTITYGR